MIRGSTKAGTRVRPRPSGSRGRGPLAWSKLEAVARGPRPREQREAMEREAQLRREEAERRDRRHRRGPARTPSLEDAPPRRPRSARKHVKSTPRLLLRRPCGRARRRPAKTRAENEDTWKAIMRDLAAPENSKRRALAHEKLRKELDRHKKEWDKFERDFQRSDATRMPLPSLDREPPVAATEAPRVRAPVEDDVDVRAVQRGGPFVVRHRTEPKDLYAWVSHDAMRLQWRALDMGAADGAPCGFAALDAVDSVRVRHRKGVPVICVKEPGRKLFLELAPESDVTAATWASTLTHLVRLARESSAFS